MRIGKGWFQPGRYIVDQVPNLAKFNGVWSASVAQALALLTSVYCTHEYKAGAVAFLTVKRNKETPLVSLYAYSSRGGGGGILFSRQLVANVTMERVWKHILKPLCTSEQYQIQLDQDPSYC